MDNLVPEHRCQFGFVAECQQQPSIDRDLAPRQGPGVRRRFIEHNKLIWQRSIAYACDPRTHLVDVLGQRQICKISAALRLLRRCILLLTNREFRLFTDERQFIPARYWVDRTAGCGHKERHDSHKQEQGPFVYSPDSYHNVRPWVDDMVSHLCGN